MLRWINQKRIGFLACCLLSIYPITYLYVRNIEIINWEQLIIPFTIISGNCALFYFGFFFKIKSEDKMIIIPFIIIITYTYTYIHIFLTSLPSFVSIFGSHRFLIPILLISIFLFTNWIIYASTNIKKLLLIFLTTLNLIS